MPRHALVTGGAGQDGSYLIEYLLDRDYVVHAQSRTSDPARPQRQNLHWHAANICDPAVLRDLVAATQPDEIYNLASVSRPVDAWRIPYETCMVNAVVPQQICDIALKLRPGCRIFQASSSEIFGDTSANPQNESTPYRPQSPYGIAKLYAHQMIGAYRANYGLHASSGIMFNHESPRRPLSYVSQKIAHAAAAVSLGLRETKEQDERGRPILRDGILLLGNLDVHRDFGFAGDYVEAMHRMLQAESADDYVIGTGQTHSIREFCEIAFRHIGRDWIDHVKVDPDLVRPTDSRHTLANSFKAQARLGWRARTSFPDLVAMMVDHRLKALRPQGAS